MTAPAIPMCIEEGDPAYAELACAEAAFWAQPHGFGIEADAARAPLSSTDRYTNARFTGDPLRPWHDDIARHGLFRRGLSLGASGIEQDARILGTNPSLHLTICDISDEALARWQRDLGARFPGRVETAQADFNFCDLPRDAYDLIVSSSSLHHVMNLERIASQINGALTQSGIFVLQDYCGENRCRFDARKKQVFELLHARDLARRPGRPTALRWVSADDGGFSPFCGVRSQDTLGVLARFLALVRLRTAGALVFPLLLARPEGPPGPASLADRLRLRVRRRWLHLRGYPIGRVDDVFFDELAFVGDTLADAGLILPGNVYAIYRKRPAPAPNLG
jgi:SAM-dependent methyltransferase